MMDSRTTVRAWKDEAFRLTLSDAEQALLPDSPAGTIDLSDADLGDAAGASGLTETSICASGWPCVTVTAIAVSKNISCGACENSMWSGSCYFSSIGCCPEM